jgi:hypothetical protein
MQEQQYDRLKTCVLDSLKLNKKFMNSESGLDLTSFLRKFKKGSRQFRKIFDGFADSQLKKNRRVSTFFNLTALPVPEHKTLITLQSLWTCNVYPMRLRDFIFKFRNNLLGLNTRVSHFNNTVSRNCTFCSITSQNNPPNTPDETFVHLFFSCPHTKRVIKSFIDKFTGWDTDDDILMKKFIFTGLIPETNDLNFFALTISTYISFYIWQCKLQKKLPILSGLCNDIFYYVDNIRVISPLLRLDMNLNLPLCRLWAAESSQRR